MKIRNKIVNINISIFLLFFLFTPSVVRAVPPGVIETIIIVDYFSCDVNLIWGCDSEGNPNPAPSTPDPDSCTGSDPAHSTMCDGDSTGLLYYTEKTVVSSCTPETKCEYTCNSLYHNESGTCVANPVPTLNLSVSPASIVNGDSSAITWSTSNTTSCTASVGWSGAKSPTGGSETVQPDIGTHYNMQCFNSYGDPTGLESVYLHVVPRASFRTDNLPCIDSEACISDCEVEPLIRWDFFGPALTPQDAFHFIFDNNSNLGDNSPLNPYIIDTGKVYGSTNEISPHDNIWKNVPIFYNHTYHAYVKVWDIYGNESPWTDIQFTTHEHKFPVPYFKWFLPEGSASAMEEISFWDTSLYFYDAPAMSSLNSTTTPGNCLGISDGNPNNCQYEWTSTTTGTTIEDDDAAISTAIYPFNANVNSMTLRVTDGDGYSCATSSFMFINKRLPSWIEAR